MHTSLRLIQLAFARTPWETFAALVAFLALLPGGGLAFYPDVYTLSKSYAVLAQWWPNAKSLGAIILAADLTVLLLIHLPLALYGLLLVFLLCLLLALSSLLAVGISAGTLYYLALAALAYYAFFRSGGIRRGP